MKYFIPVVLAAAGIMGALNAEARDEHTMLSIQEAMSTEDAKAKLDKGIRFFFGDQKHPKVEKRFGEFMSNKKTNAFNKTDERACQCLLVRLACPIGIVALGLDSVSVRHAVFPGQGAARRRQCRRQYPQLL